LAFNLSNGLSANQGHICEESKVSRGLGVNRILNSEAVLLKLVKSIENYRKIIKMQNEFCWIPGEEPYNFCKA
jgi:hypothetical protein